MADLSLIRFARASAARGLRAVLRRGPARTFVLGVGAQKAGTSWLFRYLRQHPECAMGPLKEHAVFCALPGMPGWPDFRRQKLLDLRQEIDRQLRALDDTAATDTAATAATADDAAQLLALLDALSIERDPDARYVAHFDRLLAARPECHLTGDITPAYAMLGAAHFAHIRALLRAGGYRPRVVFLIRDPVERCYSMVRMAARNRRFQGAEPGPPAHLRFAEEALEPGCEARTRYDRTIRALEQAFSPDELFIRFYEGFITEAGIADLTRFLGIRHVPPVLAHRENASPREADPPAEAIARVRAHYAPVYDFCIRRFGLEAVRAHWPHAAR